MEFVLGKKYVYDNDGAWCLVEYEKMQNLFLEQAVFKVLAYNKVFTDRYSKGEVDENSKLTATENNFVHFKPYYSFIIEKDINEFILTT